MAIDASAEPAAETIEPFLLGLIAGEGSFIARRQIDKSHTLNVSIRVQFQIQIHERDRDVIEQLRAHVGYGRIDERTDRPYIQWRISKMGDCLEFGAYLQEIAEGTPFLLTDKARAFEQWFEIVRIVNSGEQRKSPEALAKVVCMCERVNYGGTKGDIGRFIDAIEESKVEA